MTTKPDLTRIWAGGALPSKIKDPDINTPGKFNTGWVSEKPPLQTLNFFQNFVSTALAHINEYGAPQWDATTDYPVGGWARSTVNDQVYVSLVNPNVNNEPSASAAQWSLLNNFLIATNVPGGDIDTLTTNGYFSITGATGGTLPDGLGDGQLKHFNIDANTATQSAVVLTTDERYNRVKVGGVWGDWVRVVKPSDLTQVLHVREEQASGIDGGSSIAGVQTRILNTVVTNTITGASLSSNQITLPAGTYSISASVPGFRCGRNGAYFYNVTTSSVVDELIGTTFKSGSATEASSHGQISGILVLGSSSDFEVRHRTNIGTATFGLGISGISGQKEIYTNVIITKIA